MKSHKKFAKHNNPLTGEPFVSLRDRFEHDTIYRYRMMSAGWSADMMEPLQKLLTEPILGEKPSHRTKEQIQAAKTSYTTHPELGEGQPSAGNPDWGRTKVGRGKFREGLVVARSGQPVAPQVASLLQQHFGIDVPAIEEEEDTNDGEGQPSAGKGEGSGSGTQGSWWTPNPAPTTWTSTGAAAYSGWYSGAAASSSAAAEPTWSAQSWWNKPIEPQKKQYWPKQPDTWWSGNTKKW